MPEPLLATRQRSRTSLPRHRMAGTGAGTSAKTFPTTRQREIRSRQPRLPRPQKQRRRRARSRSDAFTRPAAPETQRAARTLLRPTPIPPSGASHDGILRRADRRASSPSIPNPSICRWAASSGCSRLWAIPEHRLPPVIHVAGTNGKGSTIAFMRAMLEAAGLVVHVYTSPHLVRFHERIRLGQPGGGRFVDEERLVGALRILRPGECRGRRSPCSRSTDSRRDPSLRGGPGADVLLLGSGPRRALRRDQDVVADPACAVITPIGLDHGRISGRHGWRRSPFEKAGIIKPGRPTVIARQDYAAAETVLHDVGRTARRIADPDRRPGGFLHP